MSRFVAGFALFLYVSVVSGLQYPDNKLKGTPTDPSIAVGVLSGGNYPDGSFSIGYGDSNDNNGGGPGANHGINTGHGQFPNVPPSFPNTGQNGGGYINGQNDIGSYGGQNNQNGANNYGVPLQNPGRKPTNPYDDNYNRPNNNTPVKNSASRFSLFATMLYDYVLRLFY